MICRIRNSELKTIYIGFHDGQKVGETPHMKYEPIPIVLEITHSQATRIVNHLYKELERIMLRATAEDGGVWP